MSQPPHQAHYGDPFSDRPGGDYSGQPSPHAQFGELPVPARYPHGTPAQSMYGSSVTLQDTGPQVHPAYAHDEENQPLTYGQGQQSYYPPGGFSDPHDRPMSVGTPDIHGNREWVHRQKTALRRAGTRKIQLTKGNFVAEHPVPTAISSAVESRWSGTSTTEFTHMRYTAATCDPDDFTAENGWNLRTQQYNRPTDLLIAVTSYNEDKDLYGRTLHGVMLNIRDICNTKQSKYWRKSTEDGVPAWQRITVALIVDGIETMDKSVLDLLQTVGVYQDGVMKKQVDGKDTVGHIFEYTTQVSVDTTVTPASLILPHGNDENNLVPVQIILVLKAQNQKKINSHRWLFNAIGGLLQPEICVLIDAGTKPGHKAIFYLWEAFYNNPHLGGACGEIHAMIKKGKKLLNPLIAAQNFEYKMSNILDKPTESAFGYVSVLPGAFSAYRFRAIQGRPLEQYFHGDHSLADRLGKKGIHGMGIFTKNMFLAEDRILCFELVAKAGERWVLSYVKSSKAETDVPESAAELIGQRRRWLNGSFAAGVYALYHFPRLYKSGHGIIRMLFFHLQGIYNIISLVFSWFALSSLLLTFVTIIRLLPTDHDSPVFIFGTRAITYWVNEALTWIYCAFLALQFIMGLGNRPKGEKVTYAASFIVYAILSAYLITCSIWLTVIAFKEIKVSSTGNAFKEIMTGPANVLLAALVATFGIYLFASVLYGDPWHMVSSFPQYLLIAPSFTNILNTYAFCNLHDVSWGTKGSDKADVLPAVKSKKPDAAGDAVVEDVQLKQEDVDATFEETVKRTVKKIEKKEVVEKPTMDDQNKTFRTRFLTAWVFSNLGLAIAILNVNGPDADPGAAQKRSNTYFSIILWSTFGLSMCRFIGCIYFFFGSHLFNLCRRS
ncbi:putativechitin synthase [Auriculariales sp. MPI-PUGE-AT-0066]|nr:putativechitin synthase [Auriculariales sp. MPI-PUGE-AT-0066]